MPFYHGLKAYNSDVSYPDKANWIARRLLALRSDLETQIGAERRPNSLIIGSWNIRAFDDGMPRLDESYHYIAEIISNFDICAIQEIKSDLEPLRRLVALLGRNWDFFVSDVSTHTGGNHERMAFVINTERVFFRNLIGEIVLDHDELIGGQQIARSPFFAAFQADWFRFVLCSTHIIFGGASETHRNLRRQEISAITRALVSRAKKEDQVYILLGDMNIERPDGSIMQALRDSDMVVPEFPATNLSGTRHYDQLAFTDRGKAERKTRLIRSGAFDWRRAVFGPWQGADDPQDTGRLTDQQQQDHYEPIVTAWRKRFGREPYVNFARSYRTWTTYEMSDHLPIWIELEVDYSDEYLERFLTSER